MDACRFDRSREPIADAVGADKLPTTPAAAALAAKRWLKKHGYNVETKVTIAERPQMAARLSAWFHARDDDNGPFDGWEFAPIGDLLTAAYRIGPFSFEGNTTADSYNVELLFEDGSAFIVGAQSKGVRPGLITLRFFPTTRSNIAIFGV
jgi:hypothetical protein